MWALVVAVAGVIATVRAAPAVTFVATIDPNVTAEPDALPYCSGNMVARGSTIFTTKNAALTPAFAVPSGHPTTTEWVIGAASDSIIVTPTSGSHLRATYAKVGLTDTAPWQPIFRDILGRRWGGVGASDSFFFIAGGGQYLSSESGYDEDGAYWANTSSLITSPKHTMADRRLSGVRMVRYGTDGIAIAGTQPMRAVEIFSMGVWHSVPVYVDPVYSSTTASDGTNMYITGGRYEVGSSLGGIVGTSYGIYRISGDVPSVERLSIDLAYGSASSTAVIFKNVLLVLGGTAYVEKPQCCLTVDVPAPHRIQAIDLASGEITAWEDVLPTAWDTSSTCASDLVYAFSVGDNGTVVDVSGGAMPIPAPTTATPPVPSTFPSPPPPNPFAPNTGANVGETSGCTRDTETIGAWTKALGATFVAVVLPHCR